MREVAAGYFELEHFFFSSFLVLMLSLFLALG